MTDRVRLVTFPATHAYVDAVVPAGVDHVDTRAPAGALWRPDPLWEPRRWASRAANVDVVHVHFGYDHVAPEVLREWVGVTRAHRVRLVVTVHDLRNPHHRDASRLDAQLAVLVPAADVVLTLTPGAAGVLHRRYGRDAVVVPHPAVFDGPAAVPREAGLVGVHLKSFRTNLGDVGPSLGAVADGVAAAGGRLRVDVHSEVADDPRTRAVRQVLARHPGHRIVAHERFDDDALREYLSRLSVSVQLHRWGTHSGWVEACHDVGTAVVSPSVGHLTEQWAAVRSYPGDADGAPDLAGLRHAVTAALVAPPPRAADRGWRRAQLSGVQAAHDVAYAA